MLKRKSQPTSTTNKKKKLNDNNSKEVKELEFSENIEKVSQLFKQEKSKEALKILQTDIDKGSTEAINFMIKILMEGILIEKNSEKAFQLCEEAITKENILPLFYQAQMLYKGEGIPQDYEKSLKLFKDFTNKEKRKKKPNETLLGEAFNWMGDISIKLNGTRQCVSYFKSSSDYGNVDAMVMIHFLIQ
jgi:hypothetical protein